jgi:hypothetical protein
MAKRRKAKAKPKARPGGGSNVRQAAATVRRYLEALQRHKPKRGRKRTPDSIRKRLDVIDKRLREVSPLQQLQLRQERMDLQVELASLQAKSELPALEQRFVQVAKDYSVHKRISYAAWREMGVSPQVLKKAGVPRTRRTKAGAS